MRKTDIWQGTLTIMVLKILSELGPQHGYGIAQLIEQTSGNLLKPNYGTLYPALLRLQRDGAVVSEWGLSAKNRRAKFFKITRAGIKQLAKEQRCWERTIAIVAKF